ncbi:MAG: serine/threonine protein kinase [Deltaproteobacteria bacterium]|nr:serine/threonine protein kinase [Deltaproteobacteria bacterium]
MMSVPPPPPNREIPAGTLVGPYKVLRKLGEGGMGIVFVAEDTRLHRTVALKVLHGNAGEDSERRYRFLREGRLAAGLTHPCIATVYEVGESGDRLYIAMELVVGRSVGALLKEREQLPIFQALRIAREVVRGLVKAHEAGIVHRDLKPENVMYGEDQVVKILDFGVAKRADDASANVTAHETKAGSLIGTPAYMSPEQAAGRAVDARSDIFSVGVMLYEMLVGTRPFEGETWQEVIISVARDPLVPASTRRPDFPPSIDALLARCLEKKADVRIQSARALLDELEALLLEAASHHPTSEVADLITLVTSGTRSLDDVSRSHATSSAGIVRDGLASQHGTTSGKRRPPWLVPIISLATAGLVVGIALLVVPSLKNETEGVAPTASPATTTTLPTGTSVTASATGAPSSPSPTLTAAEPLASASASTLAASNPTPPSAVATTARPLPAAPPPPPSPAPPPPTAKPTKQNPVLGF